MTANKHEKSAQLLLINKELQIGNYNEVSPTNPDKLIIKNLPAVNAGE